MPNVGKASKLTPSGQIVKKLLPLLRKRASDDVKGSVRTWRIDELNEKMLCGQQALRKAINELISRTDVELVYANDTVRLFGPKRINYRKAFSVDAVPCTALAKCFRQHGVYLEKQLTPLTSWSQLVDPKIDPTRQDLVLTIENGLIRTTKGVDYYSSLDNKHEAWEEVWANKRRLQRLKTALRIAGGKFRAIRVDGKANKDGVFKIQNPVIEKKYWKIDVLDESSGRFSAHSTAEAVKTYPFRATELR